MGVIACLDGVNVIFSKLQNFTTHKQRNYWLYSVLHKSSTHPTWILSRPNRVNYWHTTMREWHWRQRALRRPPLISHSWTLRTYRAIVNPRTRHHHRFNLKNMYALTCSSKGRKYSLWKSEIIIADNSGFPLSPSKPIEIQPRSSHINRQNLGATWKHLTISWIFLL